MCRSVGETPLMQLQREAASGDENADTIVFHAKGKIARLRKTLISLVNVLFKVSVVLCAVSVLLLGLLVLMHTPRSWEYFWGVVPVLLGSLLLMAYVTKKLNGPALHQVLTLSPDGFTLQTEPFLGTILWEEIASVSPARFLGLPYLQMTLTDEAAFRNRIGKKARYLWTYKMPGGGLGISALIFGLPADDLAARINRYRERGL